MVVKGECKHASCCESLIGIFAGVLSQSQVLLAFGVVAELFEGVRPSSTETMAGVTVLPFPCFACYRAKLPLCLFASKLLYSKH